MDLVIEVHVEHYIVKHEVYTGEDVEAISKHSGGSTCKKNETGLHSKESVLHEMWFRSINTEHCRGVGTLQRLTMHKSAAIVNARREAPSGH